MWDAHVLLPRARSHAPVSKFHFVPAERAARKVRARWLAFEGSVETATLRERIVKLFAISQCDGIGWPAVAGSTGLCFARLLGCLSYLPV